MPSRPLPLLVATAVAAAAPAFAAPQVAVDIAPIHSIVAAVMAGVGAPTLIVPPGASEHDHALRPSEASSLAAADLVVWVGPSLTPWLEGPLDALAGEASRLTLMSAPEVRRLPQRVGGPFEAHAHDHDQAAAADGHAAPAEDAHDHAADAHAEDDHDHAADADEAHAHADHAADGDDHPDAAGDPLDPHVWLDPQNAAAIAGSVAGALAQFDPANAEAYAANAAGFAASMEALQAELAPGLQRLRGRPFFVFHDAYLYFEEGFGLPAAGAIALSDAEAPRAGRVAEIRARFTSEDILCVFAEPQYEPRLIGTLIEGTETRVGTLDPLGAQLEPGPDLYPALIRGLAADLAACLEPRT